MANQQLQLVELSLEMEGSFNSFLEELKRQGQSRRLFEYDNEPFEVFVEKLKGHQQGKFLPEGWVPYTTFFLVANNGTILGKSSLRHTLPEHLLSNGCEHIGYYIRESQQRKGYGTEILRLTLEKAKTLGLKRVLVTCDDDNIASAKIIEKNGGVLENTYQEDELETIIRRYWITIE